MTTQILQRAQRTVSLSEEERDGLLGLLRQALREDRLPTELQLFGRLIRKLEELRTWPIAEAPPPRAGIEEERPIVEELYIDETGRFQMGAAELEEFTRVLADRGIPIQVDSADAFRSGGVTYGYGRLLHPYEADSVVVVYRAWKMAGGRSAT